MYNGLNQIFPLQISVGKTLNDDNDDDDEFNVTFFVSNTDSSQTFTHMHQW